MTFWCLSYVRRVFRDHCAIGPEPRRAKHFTKGAVLQLQNGTNILVAAITLGLIGVTCIAIAQQEFSWWVFPFIVMCGVIFGSVLRFCFVVYQEDKFRNGAMLEYPNQPWMWHARWRSDVIPARNRSDFRGTLAFFVILSIFASMSVAHIIDNASETDFWEWVGVLLNLIPIVAAAYFARETYRLWQTLHYEKRIALVLKTRPVWVGSALSAGMTMPQHLKPEHVGVCMELFKIIRQEDSDGSVSLNKVVDQTISGRVESAFEQTGRHTANICVDIPPNSPETSWDEGSSVWWDLIITLRIKGTDIPLRYQVPVAEPAQNSNAT